MNTSNLQIQASIEAVLGLRDMGAHSTYILALEESRFLSGRNMKTGASNPNHAYIGFLGLLGYLCIVDLIGSIFSPVSPKQTVPARSNTFKKCLYEFTDLTKNDIRAFYGLRCSLAHDFSLSHKQFDNQNNLKCAHQFSLVRSDTHPLITHAAIPWDADILSLASGSHHTAINMRAFCGLVEDIHKDLISFHNSGQLLCCLDQPVISLFNNYTILIRPKP